MPISSISRPMLSAALSSASAEEAGCLFENHRGIITYNDNIIEIDCGSVKLAVRGDALRLEAMSGSDMFICGRIIALEFE